MGREKVENEQNLQVYNIKEEQKAECSIMQRSNRIQNVQLKFVCSSVVKISPAIFVQLIIERAAFS